MIFVFTYLFTSSDSVLKDSLKFSLQTLPLSLITSLFVHNHDAHIRQNILMMLILGSLFFYYRGVKKGFVYYLFFGIISHLLEIVFSIPLNFLLRFHLEWVLGHDISKIKSFFLFPPSGAGASGALMGMMVIDSFELFQPLKRSFNEFRQQNESESILNYFTLDNMIRYVIPFSITIIPIILERIIADCSRFYTIVSVNFFLENNWLTGVNLSLVKIVPSMSTGNVYLVHIFGIIGGVMILLLEKLHQSKKGKSMSLLISRPFSSWDAEVHAVSFDNYSNPHIISKISHESTRVQVQSFLVTGVGETRLVKVV